MRKFLKLFLLSFIIVLVSGCRLVYIEKESIDDITNMLGEKTNLKSVSVDGYSYYLPQGVIIKDNKTLNSELYYNGNRMYLYVDLVSYYHEAENTYEVSKNSYYSKKIDRKGKTGYLEINEIENKYFIEYVYNYSKIEGYVLKEDLKKTLTIMSYILNSVKYKDTVIEAFVGEDYFKYKEETFNIFKANGNDNNNYLDIIEQYDTNRKDIKDEDTLEIENGVE